MMDPSVAPLALGMWGLAALGYLMSVVGAAITKWRG